jgi:hypothetical protein
MALTIYGSICIYLVIGWRFTVVSGLDNMRNIRDNREIYYCSSSLAKDFPLNLWNRQAATSHMPSTINPHSSQDQTEAMSQNQLQLPCDLTKPLSEGERNKRAAMAAEALVALEEVTSIRSISMALD